jgi:hypothetical protein
MNGTFTSYAAVLMMPAGQVAQQRTIRRPIPPRRAAAPGRRARPPFQAAAPGRRVIPPRDPAAPGRRTGTVERA